MNLQQAVSESCTIPITGLLDCGVRMFLWTIMSSPISALVSKLWGTWRFISSPSKSALYGVVTLEKAQDKISINRQTQGHLRFNLNVDQGNILTRWPIIDILCRVGCRLKTMRSSSIMCLSTYINKSMNKLNLNVTYLVAILEVKIAWFGMIAKINMLTIISDDIFCSWILVMTSSNQFFQPRKSWKVKLVYVQYYIYTF